MQILQLLCSRRWPLTSTNFKVKVTLWLTVSQSVSLGVEPHLGLMTRYSLLLAVTILLLWGALSDERMSLSFVYAVGPCQRSLSWVWVPWDSRPYFTVSDLILSFTSPSTTLVLTCLIDPRSIASARNPYKTPFPIVVACGFVALGTCLFAKELISNGSCIFAYLAVVAQQRVYIL
jgi:hypothetical protein